MEWRDEEEEEGKKVGMGGCLQTMVFFFSSFELRESAGQSKYSYIVY